MPNAVSTDIELKQLRYFLATVEEKSIARAAVRLCISATPLRQHIMQLEGRLGVCLFRRTTRGLTLTPAGSALARQATSLLFNTEKAVAALCHLDDENYRLRIGMVSSAMWGPFAALLQTYRKKFPDRLWAIQESSGAAQIDAIMSGAMDIGFSREPALEPEQLHRYRLCQQLYHREKVALAISEDHPLAARELVSLADLAGEKMLAVTADEASFYRYLAQCCVRAGFTPVSGREAANLQTVLAMVSNGMGIALMPASIARVSWPGVVFRGIADAPSANLYFTYDPANNAEHVRAFIKVLNNH